MYRYEEHCDICGIHTGDRDGRDGYMCRGIGDVDGARRRNIQMGCECE